MAAELPPGVTPDDVKNYKRIIARCWVAAGVLITLPLESLDRFSANAETFGPLLHPDIWRENAKAIMEDREMIRALATAQRDVLATSPSLVKLAPVITTAAEMYRPKVRAAFRELFTRPELGDVPPAIILEVLVRYIGDLAPNLPPPPPGDSQK